VCVLDIHRVFLYTDFMITLARQIQLKVKKFDEVMIKLKTKYLDNPAFYSELHKLDEKMQEISKLVDNNKD
jgi:hypothetical protein